MENNIAASLGAGSGINVAQLVSDLAAASRAPKVDRITQLTEQNRARISAVALARSDLEGLADSLSQIVNDGTLRSVATVSDANILSATTSAGVATDSIAASVEVTQLAQAQSVYSAPVASRSDPIGQGSFTLSVGGASHQIVIDASNDSLDGLATAINATGSSVRASVVADGGGFRLILKGATGAANSFTMTSDAGSAAGLAAFAYGAGGTMALGQNAADAQLRVDGVQFSRATNNISDILPGLTLTLKKAAPGAPVDIGATRPVDAIKQAAGDFVDVFNQLKQSIRSAIGLAGTNSSLRQLDNDLAGLTNKALTSHPTINRLADIGISTTREGQLSLDRAKLDRAIATDPAAVEALFNPLRDATRTEATDPGLVGAIDAIRDRAVATDGVLNRTTKSLEDRQRSLDEALERIEQREAAYQARLERQYGTLDSRVGALRATQAYLEQQIALWTNQNN